jgi:hypothetical protein
MTNVSGRSSRLSKLFNFDTQSAKGCAFNVKGDPFPISGLGDLLTKFGSFARSEAPWFSRPSSAVHELDGHNSAFVCEVGRCVGKFRETDNCVSHIKYSAASGHYLA